MGRLTGISSTPTVDDLHSPTDSQQTRTDTSPTGFETDIDVNSRQYQEVIAEMVRVEIIRKGWSMWYLKDAQQIIDEIIVQAATEYQRYLFRENIGDVSQFKPGTDLINALRKKVLKALKGQNHARRVSIVPPPVKISSDRETINTVERPLDKYPTAERGPKDKTPI
jgi:hypothetical protein